MTANPSTIQSDEPKTKRNNTYASVLYFAGAVAFGINFSTLIHEFGHVVALWGSGNGVQTFVVEPFAGSYVQSTDPSQHNAFVYAAGITMESLIGLVFLIVLHGQSGVIPVLLRATGVGGLLSGSGYIYFSLILGTGGDPFGMIHYGMPPEFLMFIAIILGFLGLLFALELFPDVGLVLEDSKDEWSAVLLGGTVPYLAGYICVNFFEIYFFAFSYLIIDIIIFVILGIAVLFPKKWVLWALPWQRNRTPQFITWGQAFLSLSLGIAMTVVTKIFWN